ncbi:Fibroblast growth factor receptor 3 [Aphanomyces cochlioides]|nr:Fibroblast growth factor receptor 3 [Aphanomyces cochlioides]
MEATVAIAGFGLTQKILNLQYRKAETTAYEAWNWMSPEQYFFSRRVTSKSDVWSFGMILWEILCNDIPLRGYPEDGFRNEILISEDKRPEKPDNMSPDLEPLWTLITKCWQLDPTARPSASEIVEFLKTHYSSQWKLHSEMPDTLSGAMNKSDHIYSIHSAIEFIRQILEPIEYNKSEAMQYARVILSLSLKFQTNRQSVLETGILVGRIVDHMMRDEVLTESSKLLEILEEIQRLWESTLQTTQTWKLNFNNDSHRFTAIIGLLQDRLRQAVAPLNVDMKVRVVGNIRDSTFGIGNMIDAMDSLHTCLSNYSDKRQQLDKLYDLAIQLQRGLEYYKRQVDIGNIVRDEVFEDLVKRCENQIAEAFMHIDKIICIEPWMISSDDVHFHPNDISSILGQGRFGTVFSGMYQGQTVAVKQFDRTINNDSTDLEETIAREVKAWKDISHEPYVLTLIGVCTKIPVPILVSELCDTNIRRYVRDNPDIDSDGVSICLWLAVHSQRWHYTSRPQRR